MAYRSLDSRQILQTLERLTQRIDERFPGAGLSAVSRELLAIGRFCAAEATELGKPNWLIRTSAAVLIVAVVAVSGLLLVRPFMDGTSQAAGTVAEYLQGLEAAVNEIVFLGIAIWFLGSIEGRMKRRRALAAIHQLRSIAHVVDMHQLTKDPAQILGAHSETASSPKRTMPHNELSRYLDYCSEMLSLSSKIAALFVQELNDPGILAAVDEVSGLTTGLSQKIWQKLSILESTGPHASARASAPVT